MNRVNFLIIFKSLKEYSDEDGEGDYDDEDD